jgi:hypothetical protein
MGVGENILTSLLAPRLRYNDKAAATWSKRGFVGKRINVDLDPSITDLNEFSIYGVKT